LKILKKLKMKNIFNLVVFGAILVFAGITTSCSSYKHTHRLSQIPEKSVVIADKIGVELRVDENKVVQATTTKKHSSPNDAKDEAYYNAIVNNNIHVLVDPIYRVESSARILIFGGKSTATVSGFAGYYQNPRSYKEIQDEQDAIDSKAKQDAIDLGIKQMKQLKDDGIIKQQTSTTMSDSKVEDKSVLDKLTELSLNGNVDSDVFHSEKEYEVTKTTETTSLVDEYNEFLNGVKDPAAAAAAAAAGGDSEGTSGSDDSGNTKSSSILSKLKGISSKLMFWKKK
jgi:hypothetical protein